MLTGRPIEDSELAELFCAPVKSRLVVLAVSGGADSVALMHLFSRYLSRQRLTRIGGDGVAEGDVNAAGDVWVCADTRVIVATVDHGLRKESGLEAEFVARRAASLGFEHVTLAWLGEKPESGLQNAAREARYGLIARLIEERDLKPAAIVVAHHMDDQAETVLMRLARGSGVTGLKGMVHQDRCVSTAGKTGGNFETTVWRPLLGVPKARLLATLERDGVTWIEDCSNLNLEFERVRVRQARVERETLGLSDAAIARTARRLGRANSALNEIAQRVFGKSVGLNDGAYCDIPASVFVSEPDEVVLRVVEKTIQATTGSGRRTNLLKLEDLVLELQREILNKERSATRTLSGCVITYESGLAGDDKVDNSKAGSLQADTLRTDGRVQFFCEAARADLRQLLLLPGQSQTWARRFGVKLCQSARTPLTVRALGEEAFLELRREAGGVKTIVPRRAVDSLPSFWDAERLIYVPHMDYSVKGWDEPLARIAPLVHSQG